MEKLFTILVLVVGLSVFVPQSAEAQCYGGGYRGGGFGVSVGRSFGPAVNVGYYRGGYINPPVYQRIPAAAYYRGGYPYSAYYGGFNRGYSVYGGYGRGFRPGCGW